ncbi:MAG: M64 family metallopeptidase [Lachnospiraceae bacterium]
MKKQKVINRVSSLLLAIVMVLGLCVSPVATQHASAGQDYITGDVKIVAQQDNVTFEEGKVEDVSSYFTVEYPGAVYLYGYDTGLYFSDTDKDCDPFSKTLTVSYYKVAEDGKETALDSAPSKAGSYKAYASFTESTYAVTDVNNEMLGYIYTPQAESGVLQYKIVAEGEGTEAGEDVPSEGLQLLCGDKNLPDEDALVVLMLGDGFTESEQKSFYKNAKEIAEYLMTVSPYDEFTDVIKIYAYGTVSKESGARADKATTQAEADADTRDTYYSSSYWNGGMQRLLYVDEAKVNQVQKQVLPATDFCAVLVNATTYGGSGGGVCAVALSTSVKPMIAHEMGHTGTSLADEYWPGAVYASEDYVNMTTESDPEKVKWSRFVGKNGVGVYKYDQAETATDWYHPSENCLMQYLNKTGVGFCEVCKEEIRKGFCKDSNVTKLFFQAYADEFYQSNTGKDMREYFILRKGDKEVTGDQLGDKLTLVYKDSKGNVVDGIPNEAGTYTVEATFAGDSTFAACKQTGTYTIDLPDLITLKVADSKTYNGKAISVSYTVDYDKAYTTKVRYTGSRYGLTEDISYSSTKAPVRPGKYTVEVTAYDKATGEAIAKKSKDYKINFKTTKVVDNNSPFEDGIMVYPGASEIYNLQHITFVGEGFTKSEQAKFEKAAKEYADYILSTEPFKEVQKYFNFTSVETISDVSGIGTKAKKTYFGLTYDKNGKVVPSNEYETVMLGYNNATQYQAATIVIVNDSTHVKTGSVGKTYNCLYGGLNTASKKYVAKELLNMITNHKAGYTASTTAKKEAQKLELMSNLYYTWSGYDYAVIAGNADSKEFVSGKKVNMDGCFKTYILGKEVTGNDLDYTITYYDSKGNKLSSAPSKAGTYTAVAEIIPTEVCGCAYDNDYNLFKPTDDQKLVECYEEGYGYYWEVQDADGNTLGWPLEDMLKEVTMDGQLYHVPRTRGSVTFTIYTANQLAAKKFQAKKNTLSSVKSSAKRTLKATWTTVSGAAGYQVQYSTSSTFKNAKTITVKGSTKKTVSIKNLTSKKKYYVRVRAYKTIDGKKVYSTWATKKSVTVK